MTTDELKRYRALYWQAWQRYSKATRVPKALANERRHAAHAAALGADKSHLAFTPDEFTKVIKHFDAHP